MCYKLHHCEYPNSDVTQEFEENVKISENLQDRRNKGVAHWLKRITPTADASQTNLSTVIILQKFLINLSP